MFVAVTLILALAVLFFVERRYRPDSSQLAEPRPTVVIIGIQIICGDCAGEDGTAVKTYLDRFGNCAQCGGQSYLLAANCVRHRQSQVEPGVRSYQRALKDLYV